MDELYGLVMNYPGRLIIQNIPPHTLFEGQRECLKIVADGETREPLHISGVVSLVQDHLDYHVNVVPNMAINSIIDSMVIHTKGLMHKRRPDYVRLLKEAYTVVIGSDIDWRVEYRQESKVA
jgi:hypothetical protein